MRLTMPGLISEGLMNTDAFYWIKWQRYLDYMVLAISNKIKPVLFGEFRPHHERELHRIIDRNWARDIYKKTGDIMTYAETGEPMYDPRIDQLYDRCWDYIKNHTHNNRPFYFKSTVEELNY